MTIEQIEELSKITEEKTREYISLKVPQKQIDELIISVEAEGTKPVILAINVAIRLVNTIKNIDEHKLANDAANTGLNVANQFLRELFWQYQK